jgi:hypothetical protein
MRGTTHWEHLDRGKAGDEQNGPDRFCPGCYNMNHAVTTVRDQTTGHTISIQVAAVASVASSGLWVRSVIACGDVVIGPCPCASPLTVLAFLGAETSSVRSNT